MAYVYSIGADEALAGSHNCCAFDSAFDKDPDRYWVGGAVGDTTNWHNPLNWAGYSGGAGGAGVPNIDSNVYFDSNSNGYACIATAAMFCETLNGLTGWTNNLSTAGFELTVNGYVNITTTGVITFTNSTINLSGSITITNALSAYNCGGVTWNIKENCTYSIAEAQTGNYKKVTIYAGKTFNLLIGAILIRDDTSLSGHLTLQSSTTVYHSTGGTTSIYTNGGTATPVVANGGTISASSGYSFYLRSLAAGTVNVPNINSAVSLLLFLYQEHAVGTTTFEATANITCRTLTVEVNGIAAATALPVFNLNSHVITVSGLVLTANFGANFTTVTMNCNTGTINFVDYAGGAGGFIFGLDTGAKVYLNLNSATINHITTAATVTEDYIYSSALGLLVVNGGTSQMNFLGGSIASPLPVTINKTFDGGNNTFYNIKVNQNHATFTFDFIATGLKCNRLEIEPKSIVRFKEALSHTIANYTAGDWDGTAGNLVTIKSITDGAQHTLVNPANMTINYINVRDSIATNPINVWRSLNTDSGNNSGWIFSIPATGVLLNQNCLISGEAFHSGGGMGNLVNKATVIYGEGAVIKVGSGSLVNNNAEVNGSGSVCHPASGVLLCNASEVSGSGSSSHICSGIIINGNVLASGSGVVCHHGSGAIIGYLPILDGAGHEGGESTGNLVNQLPKVSGSGRVSHVSTGSITNQKPIVAGQGSDAKTGSGLLLSSTPRISGSGNVSHVSSGNVINQPPTIGSLANVYHVGFGSLVSYKNQINGSGNVIHPSTGELSSQLGILYGEGSVAHTGSGELNNQLPISYGDGTSGYIAKGALLNGLPFVIGNGYVFSIHIGEGKPIRIKCLYNSYARTRGRMPTQGTVKALYNSDVRLKCYLNLAEFDHRG